ncbi:hypothetical protein, partial [Weissella soli]|uniref:hypothetical protein n=1 Tax=Weissella soli TaxID=155866 RepID=UPI0035A164B6
MFREHLKTLVGKKYQQPPSWFVVFFLFGSGLGMKIRMKAMPFSIAKAAGCYRIEQVSVICL